MHLVDLVHFFLERCCEVVQVLEVRCVNCCSRLWYCYSQELLYVSSLRQFAEQVSVSQKTPGYDLCMVHVLPCSVICDSWDGLVGQLR